MLAVGSFRSGGTSIVGDMADDEQKKRVAAKKAVAGDATLVVGSNGDHAERARKAAGARGAKCVAVDRAVELIEQDSKVLLARDPADRAVDWEDVADKIKTSGATIVGEVG